VFGCWFKFVIVLPLVTPRPVSPLLTPENCVASDSAIGSKNYIVVDPAIDNENYISVNLAIGSEKLYRCRPSNRERKITSLPIQ
jgi:exosome complex RNA-binding protein Rrp42 (RNase PH superfamily)